MRKFLLFVLTGLPLWLSAQSITPYVLNIAGGTHSAANGVKLTSNVGELAITRLVAPGKQLTQGFLQPEWLGPPTGLEDLYLKPGIRLYPNPATEWVQVEAENVRPELIRLFDMQGRLVMQESLTGTPVSLDRLSPGLYSVIISGKDGQPLATYKLIKQ